MFESKRVFKSTCSKCKKTIIFESLEEKNKHVVFDENEKVLLLCQDCLREFWASQDLHDYIGKVTRKGSKSFERRFYSDFRREVDET
jgi:uncharacterized protein with PIN domain